VDAVEIWQRKSMFSFSPIGDLRSHVQALSIPHPASLL
jgi:hypothetical protein